MSPIDIGPRNGLEPNCRQAIILSRLNRICVIKWYNTNLMHEISYMLRHEYPESQQSIITVDIH